MHNKLDTLRELYEGHSPRSHRFRDSLFIFDLAAITYVIVSSFWTPNDLLSRINRMFGVLVLADLTARIAISRSPAREVIRPLTLAEIVAIKPTDHSSKFLYHGLMHGSFGIPKTNDHPIPAAPAAGLEPQGGGSFSRSVREWPCMGALS
jgi:hypothetical protein